MCSNKALFARTADEVDLGHWGEMKEGLRMATHNGSGNICWEKQMENDDIKTEAEQLCQYCRLVNSLLACI